MAWLGASQESRTETSTRAGNRCTLLPMLDRLNRPLRSLRLSVTDRCNSRCTYCMPEKEYKWLPKDKLLCFSELKLVAEVALSQGVERIRITGGEPLLRRDLPKLISMLAPLEGLQDLAMTTNGILLAPVAQALRDAGLKRITLSLDSLQPERYRRLAGIDGLDRALAGLKAAQDAGFDDIKLNTVAIRGVNDDEVEDLVRFARVQGVELRFIEYMDVGGATHWNAGRVMSAQDLRQRFDSPTRLEGRGASPSERYRLSNGQTVGIIASVSEPFCDDCDRGRVTADGRFYTCLYGEHGVDLAKAIRGDLPKEHLTRLLQTTWGARSDRGAAMRLGLSNRGTWVTTTRLQEDPHLEMHTRGG